jgi:hypothetical protein
MSSLPMMTYMHVKKLAMDQKNVQFDEILLSAYCRMAAPSLRFLSSAIPACGGSVWVRRFGPGSSGEIEFEFARAISDEIYCALMEAQTILDRGSHLRLATLCQCNRQRLPHVANKRVVVRLSLMPLTEREQFGGETFR